MSPTVYLRIKRLKVLAPGLLIAPVVLFGSYRLLSEQEDVSQWMLAIAMPTVLILTVTHYLWFYYVAVGADSVTQDKYFGLLRQRIAVPRLKRVKASSFRGWLFTSRSIQFQWSEGEINLITDAYDQTDLSRAVTTLHNLGVSVDSDLLPGDIT